MKQKVKRVGRHLVALLTNRKLLWVVGVGVVAMLTSASLSLVPRRVEFSYSSATCINSLTWLPAVVKQTGEYRVSFFGGLRLGSWYIVSTKSCLTPQTMPMPGTSVVELKPALFPLVTQRYDVLVPHAPTVTPPPQTPTSAKKPLTFHLSTADSIFRYQLLRDDKKAPCESVSGQLNCSLSALGVAQGMTYTYELQRVFREGATSTVLKGTATTLPAVEVTDSSIKDGAVMYDMTRTFQLTANKAISSAEVKMERQDGNTYTLVPADVTTKDTSVVLTVRDALPREATLRLTLDRAVAPDESELNGPYSLNFTTSGGPTVTGVNIGTSGVDPSATIVVTFDQPITGDAKNLAHISGVEATTTVLGSQIVYQLSGAARCASFTLTVGKGVVATLNNLASKVAWSKTSRINCRATGVIGYSVKGHPILAYYYGSGTKTTLFNGNIHGNEKSGYQTLQGWLAYLDANAQNLPTDRQVIVIPSMNPDGYAANTRNNAHNVNLDRNYPTADWQTDITSAGGFVPGGGGSSAGSEPETQAVMQLIRTTQPRMIASYHSQGSLVGSNSVGGADEWVQQYCSAVGYRNMTGSAETEMGYTITGELESWAGALGMPAMAVELPSNSGNYVSKHQAMMWRLATEV